MKTISYVSAPAGSGKTYGLVEHAIAEAKAHKKIIIAQPSKRLIQQTEKQIRAGDPAAVVTSIFSRTDYDRTVQRVHDHLERADPHQGEILLITHVALKLMNKAHRKFWDLYVDEIPSVFDRINLKIAKTHEHVTPFLTVSELVPGITVLTVGEAARVDELIANATDDQNIASFTELLNAIRDPNQIVCVTADRYNDLLTNPNTTGDMDFFTILTDDFVDGFASVTFMGANAEASEMLIIWDKLLNIQFVQHPILAAKLRYVEHENGHRLTIKYLFEKWSKSYSNAGHEGDKTLDKLARVITPYMDGRRFIWQANAKVRDTLFDPYSRLPHQAHGLNEDAFSKTHNVVLLSALNHSDPAYTFLALIGVDRATADTMVQYQSDYQTMMRCSLRERTATAPVEVIVTTRASAEWIAERFPECMVEALDHDIAEGASRGRKKKEKALTSTERSRLRRAREKGLVP